MIKNILTVTEAARMLRVSRQRIHQLLKSDRLRAAYRSKNFVLISRASIDRFLNSRLDRDL